MPLDNLTKAGATELAQRIANYWLDRGFPYIETVVVPLGRFAQLGRDGNNAYGVRSNLDERGYPPRQQARPIAVERRQPATLPEAA